MTDNRTVVELGSSREDEFAMLIITSTFGRSLPYVRATAHREETAIPSHPPELAIVEALITESPGQLDVIHALSSAWEAAPREPSSTTSVENFSSSPDHGSRA